MWIFTLVPSAMPHSIRSSRSSTPFADLHRADHVVASPPCRSAVHWMRGAGRGARCRHGVADRSAHERVRAGGHVVRTLSVAATHAADRSTVIFAADAPVVLEHIRPVISTARPGRRAVALELPGFGFSTPFALYRFTLGEQVDALIATLDALAIERATLRVLVCQRVRRDRRGGAAIPIARRSTLLSQVPSRSSSPWAARLDLRIAGTRPPANADWREAIMWAVPTLISDDGSTCAPLLEHRAMT